MTGLAIIGGSGLDRLDDIEYSHSESVTTPYGDPSDALTMGSLRGESIIFLARHGAEHTIPPHRINYRANLWALKHRGVNTVISVCAVGGIRADIKPGMIIIPDQIIDYTWSREHTLYDQDLESVTHIDFTEPYCEKLRQALIDAAGETGIEIVPTATYGATQGPRLETAAEINRKEKNGCDIVGMTGMPEASLARELGLCYATIAVSANDAAGRGEGPIEMDEIRTNLDTGMRHVRLILQQVIQARANT
ncbi:MAG: S-methyl-5'-thioinosine phosphorylase [Pseudomonadota bacterium]